MSSANDELYDITARCAVCQANEVVDHCRDVHDTRVSGTWLPGTWPTTCSLLSQCQTAYKRIRKLALSSVTAEEPTPFVTSSGE